MTIVVEDGSGLAGSESYISVAAFKAYHKARGRTDAVDALEPSAIESSLRNATGYMRVYATRWAGMRSTDTQRLDWPRAYVPRAASLTGVTFYWAAAAIPADVQEACAELAYLDATGTALQPPVDAGYPMKRDRTGPLETEWDTSRGYQGPRFPAIDSMLQPFFLAGTGSGMVRLVRA